MSSNMATVTCWVVLLLTMFPSRALGGRLLSATPPASSTQISLGVIQLRATKHIIGRGALGVAGTQFQGSTSPSQRTILMEFKEVKHRDVKLATHYISGHRLLVGSSPPTCQGKCGSCSPCNPIHVSIGTPQGVLTQQEYYPEVWRCKCGNRLFMP